MSKTTIIDPLRVSLAATTLAWLLMCGAAFAQDVPGKAADRNSVKLSQVIMALPTGAPWLSFKFGIFCIDDHTVRTWAGGRERQALPPYAVPFKTEMARAGYNVITPGEDNLFDPESGSADYEVAAVITDSHVEGCVNDGGYFTDNGSVRGEGSMTVDWQLYSPIKKQVVARASTSGTAKQDKSVQGGAQRLMVEAFASNARKLAENAEFHAALNASKVLSNEILRPGQQSRIALTGSLKTQKLPIADAVGSVVTLLTGSGSGSGILVSDDGYMLTNAHVVGAEKQIRTRWSDGIETVADVVRVATDRDIALVKTNPRDRPPLAIKRGAVSPGQRVYAIGSPKGKAFQGTISSGIISANRVIDGLRYIQSDVAISPGSSGGALLDETAP